METNEVLININNSLSAIYNVLWWIAFWMFLNTFFRSYSRDVKITNIKDLK